MDRKWKKLKVSDQAAATSTSRTYLELLMECLNLLGLWQNGDTRELALAEHQLVTALLDNGPHLVVKLRSFAGFLPTIKWYKSETRLKRTKGSEINT